MFLKLKETSMSHYIKNNRETIWILKSIFTFKYFNWAILALFYNYDIACLLVSAVLSYHEDRSEIIFKLIQSFHDIKIVNLPDIVNNALTMSYKNIMKRWSIVERFKKFDYEEEILKKHIGNLETLKNQPGERENTETSNDDAEILINQNYNAETLAKNELDSIIDLIPTSILLFPNSVELSGKTLLGGKISVKQCFFNIANSVSLARLIYILRHEISHKKWLLKGSVNVYSKRSPEATERFGSYQEAGFFTDNIIYGEKPFDSYPNLKKINEIMAEKIINGEPLSEDQLVMLYEPSTHISNKEAAEYGFRVDILCEGRFRRNRVLILEDE